MARTRWPSDLGTPASCTGQADQTGSAGGCQELGPGRQIDLRTARAASADSEVRPGPRPQTLRPYQAKTPEAGPEAQSTSSLPTLAHQGSRWPIVLGLAEHQFGARCAVSLLMSAHFRPSADTYIHATVYRGRGPILWAPGMLPDARVAAVTGKCCGGRLTSGPRR